MLFSSALRPGQVADLYAAYSGNGTEPAGEAFSAHPGGIGVWQKPAGQLAPCTARPPASHPLPAALV
jgi:hypothetical protein